MWFTGIGSLEEGRLNEYLKYLKAALISAAKYAPSLQPVVLVGGSPAIIPSWLKSFKGVHVVNHNLTFHSMLLKKGVHHKYSIQHGTYLRLDIPHAMAKVLPLINSSVVDTEYILYTDSDILFFKDINACSLERPEMISIGPEINRNDSANTGVLYMNVSGMGEELPSLLSFAQSRRWQFRTYDQQLILDHRWSKPIGQLPDGYNWKGYWGPANTEITIVHFHGLKPGQCLECFLTFRKTLKSPTVCSQCKQYKFLWKMVPDEGRYYESILSIFNSYISS